MSQPNINPYLKDWSAPVFNGEVYEDVEMWISTIRYGLKQRRVPQEHWVSVAFHFMGYEPRAVLDDVKQTMRDLQGSEWDWNWTRLTNGLVHIQNQAKKEAADSSGSVGDSLRRFRKEHPYAAAAAGVGLITVGGITVAPAMLVGTLNLLGFSASGVVGGSIAASIQSAVYGGAIASGSAFSMAQSAAAGGILVASGPIQAVSAGAMGLGAWMFGKGKYRAQLDSENTTADLDEGTTPDYYSSQPAWSDSGSMPDTPVGSEDDNSSEYGTASAGSDDGSINLKARMDDV